MTKVAEGRGMTLAEVRKVAKGRIWSGKDALQKGLVDSLGGLSDAITIAKQEASLSEVRLSKSKHALAESQSRLEQIALTCSKCAVRISRVQLCSCCTPFSEHRTHASVTAGY